MAKSLTQFLRQKHKKSLKGPAVEVCPAAVTRVGTLLRAMSVVDA